MLYRLPSSTQSSPPLPARALFRRRQDGGTYDHPNGGMRMIGFEVRLRDAIARAVEPFTDADAHSLLLADLERIQIGALLKLPTGVLRLDSKRIGARLSEHVSEECLDAAIAAAIAAAGGVELVPRWSPNQRIPGGTPSRGGIRHAPGPRDVTGGRASRSPRGSSNRSGDGWGATSRSSSSPSSGRCLCVGGGLGWACVFAGLVAVANLARTGAAPRGRGGVVAGEQDGEHDSGGE